MSYYCYLHIFLVFCLFFESTESENPKVKVVTTTPKQRTREHQSPSTFSSEKKLLRDSEDEELVSLTPQVLIRGSEFWFGTQMISADGKLAPAVLSDGARLRQHVPKMQDFWIDIHSVTTAQFKSFVDATGYKTEAEKYRWSFVLDIEANNVTKKEVDSKEGLGRVKNAPHWMAVKGAFWRRPFGEKDKTSEKLGLMNHPVIHVSYQDAEEYCNWATGAADEIELSVDNDLIRDADEDGTALEAKTSHRQLRLPTDWEFEFAARGGLINATFPWGNDAPSFGTGESVKNINIWYEKDPKNKFPTENDASIDGYVGTAPAKSYAPNAYGLYNMIGNVWEWVLGGTPEQRTLRGGSYVDSLDGRYNHAVSVATKQTNSGDSSASNLGFRCASGGKLNIIREAYFLKEQAKRDKEQDARNAERNAKLNARKEELRQKQREAQRIEKEVTAQVQKQFEESNAKKNGDKNVGDGKAKRKRKPVQTGKNEHEPNEEL
jgi:sulfatase modifying factor 1